MFAEDEACPVVVPCLMTCLMTCLMCLMRKEKGPVGLGGGGRRLRHEPFCYWRRAAQGQAELVRGSAWFCQPG